MATTDAVNEGGGTAGKRLDNLPSTPDKKAKVEHFDSMVRVKVGQGDKQEIFDIHKGLLKFYSGYFRAAIDNMENGRFAQEEENTIVLPDEAPDTFKMLKSWLYTRDFGIDGSAYDPPDSLISMWCFADRRQMPLVQNQAIVLLHEFMVAEHTQPTKSYDYAYNNTCEGSMLRKYLVHSHARRYGTSQSEFAFRNAASWPHECLVDLGKELMTRPALMGKEDFAEIDMCDFHVHEEGVRCNEKDK